LGDVATGGCFAKTAKLRDGQKVSHLSYVHVALAMFFWKIADSPAN